MLIGDILINLLGQIVTGVHRPLKLHSNDLPSLGQRILFLDIIVVFIRRDLQLITQPHGHLLPRPLREHPSDLREDTHYGSVVVRREDLNFAVVVGGLEEV